MVIKDYKLFEEKVNIEGELSELLDMAIDTGELDLVKFFVERGAKSEDALQNASHNNEIFRYLLHKKMPLELTTDRVNNLEVQKALIEYGHLKFIDKNGTFLWNFKKEPKYKSVIDKYFLSTDPSSDAAEWAKDDKDLFLKLLKNGLDYENLNAFGILKEPEVQKALIDFGKDQFVYQKVGFADELKNDPKYKDYVEMAKDFGKFNL